MLLIIFKLVIYLFYMFNDMYYLCNKMVKTIWLGYVFLNIFSVTYWPILFNYSIYLLLSYLASTTRTQLKIVKEAKKASEQLKQMW